MTKGSYNYLNESSSKNIASSLNNNRLMIFANITKINTQQAVSMAWKVSFPALEFFIARHVAESHRIIHGLCCSPSQPMFKWLPHGMILIRQNFTSAGPFWLSVFALAQRSKTDWAKLALLDAWCQVIVINTLQEPISRLMNHFSKLQAWIHKIFQVFFVNKIWDRSFGETLLKRKVCSKGCVEGISETTW